MVFKLWATVAAYALVMGALGCSEENEGASAAATGPTSAGSGGGGTGGTSSQGGAGGAGGEGGSCPHCNCLANDAPDVEWMRLDQDMPAPAGGIVRDGVYFLTEATVYTGSGGMTGPTGNKWKLTIEFVGPPVGPLADLALERYQGMGEERYSLAYQPDDQGVISFNSVCDRSIDVPWDAYSFVDGDPSVLTLYATPQDIAFVFEQQSSPGG